MLSALHCTAYHFIALHFIFSLESHPRRPLISFKAVAVSLSCRSKLASWKKGQEKIRREGEDVKYEVRGGFCLFNRTAGGIAVEETKRKEQSNLKYKTFFFRQSTRLQYVTHRMKADYIWRNFRVLNHLRLDSLSKKSSFLKFTPLHNVLTQTYLNIQRVGDRGHNVQNIAHCLRCSSFRDRGEVISVTLQ